MQEEQNWKIIVFKVMPETDSGLTIDVSQTKHTCNIVAIITSVVCLRDILVNFKWKSVSRVIQWENIHFSIDT